ncbi:MAG TPA: class I SAM-dependent methyltransferase [Chthoniobacterales bacterium]
MEDLTGSENVYNDVLYPARCFPQTHPDRLATVAYLRGLNPAPVGHCRVLELGCNAGVNLAPMAVEFPASDFVGVDLADKPIADGREFAAALGLGNLHLQARDLVTLSGVDLGQFDYVIAHGLYSWVPAPVRERILQLCQELLAPEGVAYVSYNAYPGNHLRDLVRGMMRFHTAQFDGAPDRVGQARGLLKFVAESPRKPDYYHAAVKDQFERLLKVSDPVVYHDDLSAHNQPFYFFQFMDDAARHGLRFVGEASANELAPQKYGQDVFRTLEVLEAANEIVREQYKDFVRGCAFRQTLLCRQERVLAPAPLAERVPRLYALCDASEAEPRTVDPLRASVFRRQDGTVVETAHPLVSAAFAVLCSEYPGSVSFSDLLERATARMAGPEVTRPSDGPAGEAGERTSEPGQVLQQALLRAHEAGFLFLHVQPHRVANRAGPRPAVSRLARFQLGRGELATNQLHRSIRFPDALGRCLAQLLDGTRDRPALVAELVRAVQEGGVPLLKNGSLVTGDGAVRALLFERVDEGLVSLAREGMLVQEPG